jgi:Ankyrin repeats (3 copies)
MRFIHVVTFVIALSFGSLVAVSQNSKQELNDQFWEAVRRGDAAAVTSLLDKGADVNAKFRYGTTALFKAAERGNVEVVKILLARGADVTVKDTFYGATAMTWALQNGHAEVVRELLEKQPASANDVLMTGVRSEKPELIKLALAKGELKKETLTTALVVASRNKQKPELAELLRNAGAVPPPTVNDATLQSYTGKYKSDAMEVTITASEGNLSVTPTGQRAQQLIPVDNTTFRALFADNVVVRFKVEEGKVPGFALTQGQNTTQFTRVVETKQP